MLQLSKEKLRLLGRYWDQFEGEGLGVEQFVQLMLNRIKTRSDDEKYELVHGSYKLFSEVDINGDGQMEWGEFMQYIIDAVSGNTLQSSGKETVTEQIAKMKAKKYNRFGYNQTTVDRSNHYNTIQDAILCQSSKVVLTFERFGKEIKFYDAEMNVVKKEAVPLKKQGFVTAVAYDEKGKVFGCATTDAQIHFYAKTKFKIEHLKSMETPCIQSKIFFM